MEQIDKNQNDLGTFFKEDLFKIFLGIFKNPVNGLADYYQGKTKKGYLGSLFLIVAAVTLFTFIPLIVGDFYKHYIPIAFKIGLAPIFIVGFIALFTFLIKSFLSKADFLKEFEMASSHAIILSILILSVSFLSVISSEFDFWSFNQLSFISVIYLLFIFYILLLMISIVKQTLSLDIKNPMLIWYLSPITVLLSIYLSVLVIKALM
ncbi:MAG: hypothetical protein LBU83_03420 [Bacteroidales bacterium]|jgi:hypothetical protein|nr:hypothetical protein [Bacteroidales bacterium]